MVLGQGTETMAYEPGLVSDFYILNIKISNFSLYVSVKRRDIIITSYLYDWLWVRGSSLFYFPVEILQDSAFALHSCLSSEIMSFFESGNYAGDHKTYNHLQ